MLLGMKFRLFIVFTLVLVSSLAVVGQTSDKTETELKSLVRRMVDAQAAFDVKALDAVLTPDYIEISPLGEFDTRDKVLGFYKPELKPPANQMPTNMELSDYSVRIYDKMAVVIVKETFSFTADGKPLPPRSLRVMFVCKREKSGWKVASVQYTGIRPKQPAPPARPN